MSTSGNLRVEARSLMFTNEWCHSMHVYRSVIVPYVSRERREKLHFSAIHQRCFVLRSIEKKWPVLHPIFSGIYVNGTCQNVFSKFLYSIGEQSIFERVIRLDDRRQRVSKESLSMI